MTRERQVTALAKTGKILLEKQCLEAAPRKGRRPGYVLKPLAGGRWAALVRRPVFSGTPAMSQRPSSGSGRVSPTPFPMDDVTWKSIAKQLALSPQQTRIVELILRGQQDKEIAAELELSIPTVRTYLSRIFDRTEVTDRLKLVLRIFAMAQQ